MARRISGEGLVNVSLRRSIAALGCWGTVASESVAEVFIGYSLFNLAPLKIINQEQTILPWQLILHPAATRRSATFLRRSSTMRAGTSMKLPYALRWCGSTMTAHPTFI
jgi:hypothetical protein